MNDLDDAADRARHELAGLCRPTRDLVAARLLRPGHDAAVTLYLLRVVLSVVLGWLLGCTVVLAVYVADVRLPW